MDAAVFTSIKTETSLRDFGRRERHPLSMPFLESAMASRFRANPIAASCAGLPRASTSFVVPRQDVDGRDKPGHDDKKESRERVPQPDNFPGQPWDMPDHDARAGYPGGTHVLSRLLSVLALWRARVRERRGLAGMDERLLRDIGVTRIEAARECEKPFWRS